MKRVVITGMSAITAFGDNWLDFRRRVAAGQKGSEAYD